MRIFDIETNDKLNGFTNIFIKSVYLNACKNLNIEPSITGSIEGMKDIILLNIKEAATLAHELEPYLDMENLIVYVANDTSIYNYASFIKRRDGLNIELNEMQAIIKDIIADILSSVSFMVTCKGDSIITLKLN